MTHRPSSLPSVWQPSPHFPSLPDDEIHVWAAPLEHLDRSLPMVSEMVRWLSPDERTRAVRFHSREDRNRYVLAHGAVREILGRYLQLAPADVLLRSLPQGKPVVAPEVCDTQLEFNLSHSHELALVAVGRGRRLGVDVERIRADVNGKAIAARFFAPGESATICELPKHLQAAAFFACWTRKEAYLKARGDGLRMSLNQFEVVVAPGRPAALLHDAADLQAPARWSLHALEVGSAYAAALAIEGRGWRLRQWLWQERADPL